jgi:hemolysin activation/secretion protein
MKPNRCSSRVFVLTPLVFALLTSVPSMSQAQSLSRQNSGQLEREALTKPTPTKRTTVPSVKRLKGKKKTEEAKPKIEKPFVARAIVVEGSTVFSPEDLAPIIKPYLDQEVTVPQLSELASALSDLYRKRGYFLSQVVVPDQTIQQGRVRLSAVEGRIQRVQFRGVDEAMSQRLADYTQSITLVPAVRTDQVESVLLLLNDLPGVIAKGIVVPSDSTPGLADLVVDVEQLKRRGSIEINNRGVSTKHDARLFAEFDVHGVLSVFDKLHVDWLSSATKEQNYLRAVYDLNVGSKGLVVGMGGNVSQSGRDASETTSVKTHADGWDLHALYPLLRTQTQNLFVRSSLSAFDSVTYVNAQPLFREKTRVVRAGLSWDVDDVWGGDNLLDAELSKGLNGLGAQKAGAPDAARPQAKVDFAKLNTYFARLQPLGQNYSMSFALSAQFTSDPLPYAEQFGFGGEAFGRGYRSSVLLGDRGFSTKLELRKDIYTESKRWSPYVFADAGRVWTNSPSSVEVSSASAQSMGVGLNLQWGPSYRAYCEVAKPLSNPPSGQSRDTNIYAGFVFQF